MTLRHLPVAEADLDEIWLHIARDNIAAADRVLDRIAEVSRLLAELPYSGRARPELQPDMRSFPVGQYVIFYRPLPHEGIEVIRVLHGARDLEGKFDE